LKSLKLFIHITIYSLICYWFISSNTIVYAEDSLGETIDCTDFSVHYVDDPSLTHEERLHLMEKAFLESLYRFELCQEAKEMANSSNTAVSNGDGIKSNLRVAGTEISEKDNNLESTEEVEPDNINSSQDKNEAVGKTRENMEKSNGKLPEDIPPAQNDDTLAAQIRYAAENETDPVKRKQLWNEYRKYKGLPTQ